MNTCEPPVRLKTVNDVQGANAAPSIAHSNVAVASGEVMPNPTVLPLVLPSAGPEMMTVSGVLVSTVHG